MRKLLVLTAVAPVAMLAACGDSDADTVADTDADTTAMADATPADSGAMAGDGMATSLADAGDYSGDYSMSGPDGSARTLNINSTDSTYRYMADDGSERTGTYRMAPDGYRLIIDDYYGSPAYFSVSNGDLVRLQDDLAIEADTTVSGERYVRGGGDNAVFSRDPEPGTPVAPPVGEN